MKNVLYIVLSLVLLTGCEKEVSSLQNRGGVKYEKNTEVGFTGVLVEKWDNGQKMKEEHYKNGKEEGRTIHWYKDGQKKFEGHYEDGKRDGLWTDWYKDGQKSYEENYKDGKDEGLWTFWDEDGNITGTKTYKNGELVQ